MHDEVSETENIRKNLAIERMIVEGCEVLLDTSQTFVRQGEALYVPLTLTFYFTLPLTLQAPLIMALYIPLTQTLYIPLTQILYILLT